MGGWLTVGEAAVLLHVHPNTVRRWVDMGLLQTQRVGPRLDRRILRIAAERIEALGGAVRHSEADTRQQVPEA